MSETSLQEQLFPDLDCFGCGPANAAGLRLRSHVVDGEVVARFRPSPHHGNGLGNLNGGIISTLLDCHSAAAVSWTAHERGWPPLPGAALPYVTAGLDVRFLRPTPLDEELALAADVLEADEGRILAAVRLEHGGKVRAEATATWKRWRPR